MFSLKFDLLFPSIEMAKATAKKLNGALKRSQPSIDPRELRRMQEELRQAKEKVLLQVAANRRLFL